VSAVSLLQSLHFPHSVKPLFSPLQLMGYAACSLSFAAFFAASQRRFMMIGATSAVIWALHYHLLGERVAAALSALSGGRNTVAGHVQTMARPVRVAVTLVVCLLVAVLAVHSWAGPLTLLPTFAGCLMTTASFWLVGPAFRRSLLVSDSCWLLFGILAGLPAGCAAAMISLGLNLLTMRRRAVPAPAALA
jgi:Bacterial inner membrane protein